MVDRIASFVQTNTLIENNLRVQSNYAKKQVQVSTGQKSDTYQGVSGSTSQILNLESDYKRLVTQSENAQIALDRSETTFDALGSILDDGQKFLADLNAAISGTGADANQIANQAQTSLEQTASLLNTQVAGRYIFSGSATKTQPVDLNGYGGATLVPPVAPATEPTLPPADTSYYQGNDYTQSVEATDGFNVDYGIKADEPSVEQIMRAYDLIRTTPGDPDTLMEAFALLENGLDALAVTRASVSQNSQSLDNRINENLDQVNLIDNMIVDLKEVDLAEVSVKLKELESQLEASYSITTDLLRLNITDFI